MTRRRRRLGLRARVTLAFGTLALALAVVLCASAWVLVSMDLQRDRQTTAAVETGVGREKFEQLLQVSPDDVSNALREVPRAREAAVLVLENGQWYTDNRGVNPTRLPTSLITSVTSGQDQFDRATIGGRDYLVVGTRLTRHEGIYFAVYSLADITRSLRILDLAFLVGGLLTAALGIGLGRWASHLALRPLNEINEVAYAVARGDLAARMDAAHDPDLHPLADAFNETVANLEHRVVVDARFAVDVSHELRTPLTSMLNSMAVVHNRRQALPPDLVEPVDLLSADLDGFSHLVVDLLDVSRHDAGEHLVLEPVIVAQLVRHVVASVDADDRIPVSALGSSDSVRVITDKRRLERIVTNLVRNAESHGGGCTGVAVTRVATGVRITVDDNGPGVPLASRDRIFERFARGSRATGPGSGLGLAIVRRHAELLGATVSVTDAPQRGARLVVDLPDRVH